jgi:hypothetical protein
MKKQPLLGHLLTLILGGFIYISFRTESLTMFKWFAIASLDVPIAHLRAITLALALNLPSWLLYSLPNGLWVFSYISLMLMIWKNKINQQNISWFFLVPLMAILSEIGQLFKIVPGKITTIDRDIMDKIYITLKGDEYFGDVQCFFAEDHTKTASKLSKGQRITVKGKCEGKMMNILLKGCIIE